jgi:hypothetical protein
MIATALVLGVSSVGFAVGEPCPQVEGMENVAGCSGTVIQGRSLHPDEPTGVGPVQQTTLPAR